MFGSIISKPKAFVRTPFKILSTTANPLSKKISSNVSSFPHIVNVSQEEKSSGTLTWKNLELANRALHHDGLVVLQNAISHAKLDFLNKKMVQDALKLQSAGDESPYNYNKGNIQQDPPMTLKYFDKEIFLNPLAMQVTSSILGPRPRLSFVSGNSALPPTPDSPPQAQPTHSDADFMHPSSPFALVVNVPLIDMTPDNGSTEVWLGTHTFGKEAQEGEHGERASGRITKEFLERKREEQPPSQPLVKKGSIIVRDLRLWHGGMPNHTSDVRVMLAMIHFAPWYRNSMHVTFAEELKPVLEEFASELQIQGNYVPEQEVLDTYLKGAYGNAYDFNQQEPLDVAF